MFHHNLTTTPLEIGKHVYKLMVVVYYKLLTIGMHYHITYVALEQLSLHMLFHACSKQDIEPVVAEMFLQVLFCLSFDQLLDVKTLFLIEQKLQCKNI